ncbi:MAG TPA: membrane protein insertion efficiency factor YidD [Nitrospirae bacterium]|nr:membrane protein insertion efficiency factor YidD [Nitrospirota bacterium]
MKSSVLFAIKLYKRYISPFLPHTCRFYPSCSSYCMEAVGRYGLIKGLRLFAGRIVKCHPLHPGGYDPLRQKDNSC